MSENTLKECYDVETKLDAFYTGGNIEWSEDGENLFCQNYNFISVVSVSKGAVKQKLGQSDKDQEDTINSFTVSGNGQFVVTHHKSSLFKLWNVSDGKSVKVWKSIHNGPVPIIALNEDASNMASGGIDGSVRLWDFEHHACTHNLQGPQGVIGVLNYHPDKSKELVFASGDDNIIYGWNTQTGSVEVKLTKGHMTKVTSLSFHADGVHVVSSGRDKVLILWDIVKKTPISIVPVFECIEKAFIIPYKTKFPNSKTAKKSVYVACAGEKGAVKIWEMTGKRLVYEQTNSKIPAAKEENGLAVTNLLYNKDSNSIGLVSTTHDILIYSLDKFECKKQIVGNIDEILDIAYIGNNNSHLAVATNTADIKIFELSTMNVEILCGHTNIVLSLAASPVNPNLLLSSDKDHSVRLWLMDEETKVVNCIGVGTRHTGAVGSLAFSQVNTKFFVSVSQDLCLKLWDMPEKLEYTGKEVLLNAVNTVKAHEKDVNSVMVSPNDKLIATGSQDKTAKLWSADNLELIGVFRGHRRGVWCVRFSPIDQILATSSADCTIKLWSLSELNCLKTFEGHDSAVLKIEFLSRGMQILSAGSDGLLKMWSVKTAECNFTLDQHDSRVYALAVEKNESHIASGGSDSLLVIWKDTTQEKKDKALAEQEETMRDDQKLANYLQAKNLKAALKLALKRQKPLHALRIIEDFIKKDDDSLQTTICDLKPYLLEELLNSAIVWNTNARNSRAAQLVINIIMQEIGLENIESSSLKEKLEPLIPYTDRHFKRLTQSYQELHLLIYTLAQMKSHITEVENPEEAMEVEM